jgi:hypothetical protein
MSSYGWKARPGLRYFSVNTVYGTTVRTMARTIHFIGQGWRDMGAAGMEVD